MAIIPPVSAFERKKREGGRLPVQPGIASDLLKKIGGFFSPNQASAQPRQTQAGKLFGDFQTSKVGGFTVPSSPFGLTPTPPQKLPVSNLPVTPQTPNFTPFTPNQAIPQITQGAPAQPNVAQTVTPPVPPVPTTPTGLTEQEALAIQATQQAKQTSQGQTPPPPPPPETQTAISSAEKAFQDAQRISPEALSTQEDIDKLIESAKKSFLNIKDQPIPLGFITGQLASVERRALGLAEPLQRKLARLQAARTSAISASKFALERADDAAKTERPLAVSPGQTVIDPTTGETIFQAPAKADEGGFTLDPGDIRFDAEGNIIARGGPKPPSESAEAKAAEKLEKQSAEKSSQVDTVGLVNSILGSGDLGTISGISRFGISARIASSAGVRSKVSQLKALTSLGERQKLKGSGTISDFEARMLGDSANALNFAIQDDGRIAMPDKEVEQNLKNIRGVLLSRLGQDVDVLVTKGADSVPATLSREDIESLIKDGAIIEYQ